MEIALLYTVGAERGAERQENRVERRAGIAEKRWSRAERGAGGRGAGTERERSGEQRLQD